MGINATNTTNLNKNTTTVAETTEDSSAVSDSSNETSSIASTGAESTDRKGRISDLRSNLGLGEYDDNGRAMVSGTIYKDEGQHIQTKNQNAHSEYVIAGEVPPPPEALDFWPEFYARGKGTLEWDVPETKNFLPPPPPPPPPGGDPLLLDLDGDGIELTSRSGGTQFDLNGDGDLDQTSWTKSSNDFDDAFLVFTDTAETNQRTISSTQTKAEEKAERLRQARLSSRLEEAEANKQAYESELSSVESEVNNATSKSSTVKITKPVSSENEETEAVDVSSSEDDDTVLSRKDSLTADVSSIDSEIENLRTQIE